MVYPPDFATQANMAREPLDSSRRIVAAKLAPQKGRSIHPCHESFLAGLNVGRSRRFEVSIRHVPRAFKLSAKH